MGGLAGHMSHIYEDLDLTFEDLKDLLRDIVTSNVDLYEKIRTASGGVAASPLVGNKCNGCNLAINAVEMQRIKSLALDELLRCEECRRILVRI